MHTPVLLKEVIEVLDPKPGQFFIDGTIDGGGHAAEIIRRLEPNGIFLGIDWDENMVALFNSKIPASTRRRGEAGKSQKSKLRKILIVNDNYSNMRDIVKINKLGKADGLLLDLGFSSEQLENSKRGFSYLKNEPLLMNYSGQSDLTAKRVVNDFKEKEMADIIYKYGEERYSRRIAREIASVRKKKPIETTLDLVNAVKTAVPKNYEKGRLHPAQRTFQALRIYVNKELDNLEKALNSLPAILERGGRAAIISFHSLEDRIVKNIFKEMRQKKIADILTKKPIRPMLAEIIKNPRSSSAKLRACQII